MVTGRFVAFLLPAFVVLTNYASMPDQTKSNKEGYGDAFREYGSQVPAIIPGLAPVAPE